MMDTTDDETDLLDIKCEVVIKEEPVDTPIEDEPFDMDMNFSIKKEALDDVDLSAVNPLMHQAHLLYQQNFSKRIKLEATEDEDCLDELAEEMKYEQLMSNDSGQDDKAQSMFVNNKIATELVRNQSILNQRRNSKIVEKLSRVSHAVGTPLMDPNVFTCKICKSSWASQQQLSVHIKEKHTSKHMSNMLSCDFCDYTFKKKLKLEEHLMACHGDRRKFVVKKQETFTCALCPFKCGSSLALIVHMKVHDEKPHPDGVFRCSECSYQGASLTSLKSHRYQTHTRNKLANKNWQVDQNHRVVGDQFVCNLCDFTGANADEMKIHRFQTHDKEDLQSQFNFKKQKEALIRDFDFKLRQGKDFEVTESGSLKCADCDYESTYLKSLNLHRFSKHRAKSLLEGVEPVKVTAQNETGIPNKVSAFSDSYAKPLLGCQLCDFKTLEPSSFEEHMVTHQKIQLQTSLPQTVTSQNIPKPAKAESLPTKSQTVPVAKNNTPGTTSKPTKSPLISSESTASNSKPAESEGAKLQTDSFGAAATSKKPVEDNVVLKAELMPKSPNESKKIKITCGKAMQVNLDSSKPLLGCHLCKFRTLKDEYMDLHLQKMHGLHPDHKLHCTSYSCINCQKMYSSVDLFLKHQCGVKSAKKTEVDSQLLKCGICDRHFLDKTFLQRHIKYHLGETPISGSKNLNCPKCDKVFMSAIGLLNHVKSAHNDQQKEIFKSIDTDKKIRNEKENPRNKALVGSDDSGSDTSAESDIEQNESKEGKVNSKHKYTLSKKKRKTIESKETNNGSFECSYCNHVVQTNKGLHNHQKDIWGIEGKKLTKPDLKCQHCQFKTNKSELNMVEHLMEKHTELPRQCDECNFQTVFEPIMSHHIKFSHSKKSSKLLSNCNDGAFQCQKCEFKTKSGSNLKSHLFSKHNIKPILNPKPSIKDSV